MPIHDISDGELLKEWWIWDQKINNTTSWGAALAAALEFRQECEQEIKRRNLKGTYGVNRTFRSREDFKGKV